MEIERMITLFRHDGIPDVSHLGNRFLAGHIDSAGGALLDKAVPDQ
ncbi:hypothetical protein SDC9_174726 [bioreactor metagenome]|uniref:Uncharacterized protein n=1 Tax=bioreactor metagenome TaxID=1076179 RepID=A0A645GKP6_9ZZZZ